jgi:hemoglobin
VTSNPETGVSLYESMGGEPKLRAVIDDFVERMFVDLMIGFFFWGADKARIKAMELELAASVLDPDRLYTGRPLRQAHAKHRIMGGHFARRTQLLRQVLEAHAVPQAARDALLEHTERLRPEITSDPDGQCID